MTAWMDASLVKRLAVKTLIEMSKGKKHLQFHFQQFAVAISSALHWHKEAFCNLKNGSSMCLKVHLQVLQDNSRPEWQNDTNMTGAGLIILFIKYFCQQYNIYSKVMLHNFIHAPPPTCPGVLPLPACSDMIILPDQPWTMGRYLCFSFIPENIVDSWFLLYCLFLHYFLHGRWLQNFSITQQIMGLGTLGSLDSQVKYSIIRMFTHAPCSRQWLRLQLIRGPGRQFNSMSRQRSIISLRLLQCQDRDLPSFQACNNGARGIITWMRNIATFIWQFIGLFWE